MIWSSLARFFACAWCLCLGMGSAGAQPLGTPPSWAVMALLADRITMVTTQPTVGSHLDRNTRQDVRLPDDALDAVAAFAAEDTLKELAPGTSTSLFTTRDARILALAERAPDDAALPAELLAAVKPLVAASGAERLLVIWRHRGDARIRFADGLIGSGRLAGVGFYIDRDERLLHLDSGRHASGYVAPYAYVRASAYELATLRPLGSANATATSVITYAKSPTAVTAWEAMNGNERFDALKAVVRQAVAQAVAGALR